LASNTGVDSGLKTTDGHAISLFNDGNGHIIGVYDANNNGVTATDKVAFALHVDAATGQVAVAQYVSLQHPDTTSNDEGIALGAGSVSVTVTATDGDGDHVTQSADISQTIVFEDDGPKAVGTASITANVDEDGLAGHNPDAGRPGETGAIGLSATVTGAAGALTALVDFGADGPGAQAFHLASTAVPADSGLTSQGAHVLIVSDGSTLHGYAEAGNGAGFSAGDREIFQLTVGANGSYVFTLKDQIDHPALDGQAGDNGENQLTSPIDLSSYIVATDGDGDSISLGAGTFLIQVLDDIPVQTSATVSGNVGEDALLLANSNGHSVGNPDGDGLGTVATGSLSSLVSAGADEPGSFSLIQNPAGLPAATSKGEAIVYHVDGTVLTGYVESGTPGLDAGDRKVFTLDVQPNGTYTFTLLDQIDHLPNSPANDDNQKLVLDFTHALQFTDADGDTIAITGETTTTTATTGLSLHSGHYGTYTVGGVTFDGLTFNGALAHDFNNGAGSDSFNVSGQGVGIGDNHIHDNEGFIFSRPGTDAVSFTINGNGSGTISWEAYNGAGVPVSGSSGFQTGTTTVPADGSVVTIDPAGTFDHLVIRFDLDSGDKIRAENFLYTSTTTTSGGVFTIGIEDDIPVALNGSATLPTVYEDTLTGLSSGNSEAGSQPTSVTFGASAFVPLLSIGADDDATFSFNVEKNGTQAGVSSGGSAVHFVVGVDAVDGVAADGRTVFTIADNNNGTFTLTLLDHLDHSLNSGDSGTMAIDIGSLFKATDFDGDSVNLAGTLNIVVENDRPVIVAAETTVAESTAAGSTNAFNAASATGSLGISWGADNANPDTGTHDRSVAFSPLLTGVQAGLTSNGDAITYTLSSNDAVLTATATHNSVIRTIFTVSINDQTNGNYSFNLQDNIDHPAGADHNDKALSFGFNATDSDGDSTSSAFTVHVTDDIPVVTSPAGTGNVSESLLPLVQPTSGNLNIDWNADDKGSSHLEFARGPGNTLMAPEELTSGGVSLDYTVRLAANGVDEELVAFKQGDTVSNPVFMVTLNGVGTPTFVFTLWQPLDHDHTGGSDASLPLGFTIKAVDGDGDSVTQSFTVNVADDVPAAAMNAQVQLDDDALGGNPDGTGDVDPDTAHTSGTLGHTYGADGAGTTLLTGATLPVAGGFSVTSNSGTDLIISQMQNNVVVDVLKVHLADTTSGAYTVTQLHAIEHPAGDDENNLQFGVNYTVTDGDHDTATGTLSIDVDDDTPTASVSASQNVAEGTTVTGVLDFVAGADGATVTQINGKTLVFGADGYSQPIVFEHGTMAVMANGSYTFTAQGDDVYLTGGTATGTFTVKDGDGDTSTANFGFAINDTTNDTTVNLSASTVSEGAVANYVFTATLSNASQGVTTITTNQGDITIANGQTTGTLTIASGNDEDVYLDASSRTATIINTSGGNFEHLVVGAATATAQVTDTTNTVTATLTSSTIPVSENGGSILYTVTLTGTPGSVAPTAPLTFTLANGETVTVATGATTGSVTHTYTDAQITNQANISNSIASVQSGGSEYEHLVTAGSTTVDVNYLTTLTGLTLQASGGDTFVDEKGLDIRSGEPAGSGENDNNPATNVDPSESNTGAFGFTSPDGLVTLTIGTTALTLAELQAASPGAPVTILGGPAYGLLQVTSFVGDATGGTVTYKFTLLDNVTHPNTTADATPGDRGLQDQVFANYGVVVTDTDGSSTTSSLDIAIRDDGPTAHNDTDSFGTGIIGSSILGNVIDGAGTNEGLHGTGIDTLGADGAKISGVTGSGGSDTDVAGGGFVVSGQFGTLALQEDGSYAYTRVSGLAGSDVFTYTLKDGDGDTSTATLTVGLDSTGQPTATSSSIVVDEDDLAAGVHNTNSTGDDTTSNPANMSLGSYGPDGHGSLGFNVANGDTVMDGAFTVKHDGVALHYYYDTASHTLYGTTDTSGATAAASHAAFKIEVDETAATYNFTLLQEVDHPQGGDENDINLSLSYTITDSNGDHANGTVGIKIDDDMPTVAADTATAVAGTKPTMNAILVLDFSQSMNDTVPGTGQTRLALMKSAVADFLASNDVTFTQITVYTFGISGSFIGQYSDPAAAASAIAAINSTSAGTNYASAVSLVSGTTGNGYASLSHPAADQTNLYFLTDGDPTGGTHLTSAQQTAWTNFLNDSGNDPDYPAVNHVYAVGFSDINNTSFLDEVAQRNQDSTQIVKDPTILSATLSASLPGEVNGNLLGNDHFGADGGHVYSITVNGTTYTWNGATGAGSQITEAGAITGTITGQTTVTGIATAIGGHFSFHFDTGAWTYTSPTNVASNTTESLNYTLVDGDGDKASSSLTVNVVVPAHPETNAVSASGAEDALDVAITLTGSDGDGTVTSFKITSLPTNGTLYLDAAHTQAIALGGSVPAGTSMIHFVPTANYNGQATFQYAAFDNDGLQDSTPATATITVTAVNDAPTATMDSTTYAATAQTSLTLSGTGLSIADVDAGSGSMTVTLSVTEGTLSGLAGNSGATVSGSGSTLTITGTVTQINNLLGGVDTGAGSAGTITYVDNVVTPSSTATLTLTVHDNGNTGGGDLSASDTATISIAPLNHAPVAADLTVVSNYGGGAFAVADAAFLAFASDPDGNMLSITGASAQNGFTTLNHNSGQININDNNNAGGTFTYTVSDGSLTDTGTVTYQQDTDGTVSGTSGRDIVVGNDSASTLDGAGGSDVILGGSAGDTIIADQVDLLINGGGGTDTLSVNANFTSSSDAQLVNIENVTLAAAATLNLSNQTEGFKIIGSSGIDTIVGGAGADTINARGGNDTLTGDGGADQFRLATNTGTDTITDFQAGIDKIGFLEGTGAGAVNFGISGTAAGQPLTNSDGNFTARSSIGAIDTTDDNQLVLITSSTGQTSAQIAAATAAATNTYMAVFNSTLGVGQIWHDTDWSTTGSRVLVATLNGVTAAQMAGLQASDFVVYNSATDPIVLDLNHNGFTFSDLSHGVQFDINGDGAKDQVAWNTSNDGMLAVDLNHDGKIDDGTELFTPSFGGGKFASGAAALASLDGNHDGVIDHNDAAFDSLLIWKDANTNGASDAGELSHLADNGIVSISTAASPAVGEIDGQTVTGNGTFQMADGTTGNYVEVELDTSLGAPAQPTVASDGTKTFAIGSLEVTDLIADFHDGAKGDQIDLTALLKGLAGVTDLEAGGFVEIAQSSANAANAEVKVDTNGGGDNYHTVAVLENYTFHSAAEAVKILYDDSHGTKQDVA
ncbi:type I secretion C-terminal target domain-containing protein, partial [Mesorhizobium sp. B2-1-5]